MEAEEYELFTNQISYLGHVIHPRSLKVLRRTKDAMGRVEHVTNVIELLSCSNLRHK